MVNYYLMRIFNTHKIQSDRGLKASAASNVSQLNRVIMDTSTNVPNIPVWQNINLKDLLGEKWMPIPGYEGIYKVSNLGRVKSLSRPRDSYWGGNAITKERILRQSKTDLARLRVTLIKNKKRKCFQVSQLVAMAFLGHKRCGYKYVIDHINNDPDDNRVENLQITTPRHNASKDRNGYTSSYLGVSRNSNNEKWRAQIHIDGKTYYLGSYKCEVLASKSYQKALKNYLDDKLLPN